MTNFTDPYQRWERLHGVRQFGGSCCEAAAASIHAASSLAQWAKALLVPGLQALATISVLKHQHTLYKRLYQMRIALVDGAVSHYTGCVDSLMGEFESAYPDKPKAAEYKPIDACCIVRANIECGIATVGRANEYAEAVNFLHHVEDVVRSVVFDPRFRLNLELNSLTINDLLRGKLPVGDVVETLTDSAEQALLTGRVGSARSMTLRDLGISRMKAQQLGREEFRRHHEDVERNLSPVSRNLDLRSMELRPQDRIALGLAQAQLIQNSLQNLYNSQAMKDPWRMAQLNAKLAKCQSKLAAEAGRSGLVGSHVPNYAEALMPLIGEIGNMVGQYIPGAEQGTKVDYNPMPPPDAKGGMYDSKGGMPYQGCPVT
jgi:hypothetical protein